MAEIQFTLNYTAGQHLMLAGSSDGTASFCIDADWTLTLVSSTNPSSPFTESGTPCGTPTAPIDLGTALSLDTGEYGGEFTITAPKGATTDGTSDVYLLPVPGTVTNLTPVPGSITAPAELTGSTSVVVGTSGTLNVTLGGLPLPGITGYHAIFGWDPSGVQLGSISFPTGWGGGTRNNFANGDAGFEESTSSAPDNVGAIVLSLHFSCAEVGSWPVSFTGDYWLPGSSAGYADAVEGAATITCTAPPASATPAAAGITLDPVNGDVSATVTGSGLVTATAAELLSSTGSVVATSSSVSAAATVATATFGAVAPGSYNLEVTDGADVLTTTTGTPFLVQPALPYFSLSPVDLEGDVPGIATTHIYRVTNQGTVDGTAVLCFTFPTYLSNEPSLFLPASPAGTELLLHGFSGNSWVEYVAVPLDAGAEGDVAWTTTLPPSVVFGVDPAVALGNVVPTAPGLAGQYTGTEWTSVSSDSAQSIVDGAVGAGMSAYSAVVNDLDSLSNSAASSYLAALPDKQLAGAIAYLGSAIVDGQTTQLDQSVGSQGTQAAPAPTANEPTPAAPTTTTPSYQDSDLAAGSSAPSSSTRPRPLCRTTGCRTARLSTDMNDGALIGGDSASSASEAVLVGNTTAYDDGSIAPVATTPAGGYDTARQTLALDASWQASSQSVDLGAWTSGITDTLSLDDSGTTVAVAGLPYSSSGNGSSSITALTYTGTEPGADVAGVDGPAASFDPANPFNSVTENGQNPDATNLSNGWNAVSGFFPSYSGLFWDTVGGVAGAAVTIAGGPLWLAVAIPVLAWCLGGGCSGMWNSAHAVGSEDPNNLTVDPVGAGTDGWITGQPLTYQIAFENEPTATAAANTVTVTAQLNSNLDPSTLQFGDSSFAGTEPSFDPATDTLTWVMPGIDLPPDTSPPDGEGYVSFTASPKAGLAEATTISEQAQVTFDFNPPIDTPTVSSTLDVTPPTATLAALPTLEPAGTVPLSWSSTSPVGIATYVLYQSTDGGPLTPVDTTGATTDDVTVAAGHTYGFAVEAADDLAGLAGTVPATAQESFTVTADPGAYNALAPRRICDTRAGNPSGLTGDAAQCTDKTLTAGHVLTIKVADTQFDVPAGATAAVLNVTAVNATAKGYLTVFPAGRSAPTASNLNFPAGVTVPNLVEVGLGTGSDAGEVSLVSNVGTDVVVDLEGYVDTAAGGAGLYKPLATPARICDTRAGNPSALTGGAAQCDGGSSNPGRTLAPNTPLEVTVDGVGGVPASGVSAVVLNVTAVEPTGRGYVTVYPAGGSAPLASNLNVQAGQVRPNRVIVPVSAAGDIDIVASTTTDVIVDVSGWYTDAGGTPGAQFVPEPSPVRICDTRAGNPSGLTGDAAQCNGGAGNPGAAIGPGGTLTVEVTNDSGAGVPADATAVVLNVTAVDPSAQTYLSIYPGPGQPPVSDLNPAAGTVDANLVVATVSASGTVTIYNHSGTTNLVVDVTGWYQ